MRSSLVTVAALMGMTFATPVPQDIDFAMVEAAPDPVTTGPPVGVTAQSIAYDASTAIIAATQAVASQSVANSDAANAPKVKRTACQAQPAGATGAPAYASDSPSGFLANLGFSDAASAASTPAGYTQSFQNLKASNNCVVPMDKWGLLLLKLMIQNCVHRSVPPSTDVWPSIFFERIPKELLQSRTNMHADFERDPSVEPGASCEDPPSVTMIKCVFWGGPVSTENAVNSGQHRDKFQVVIAGSNGYTNNSIAPIPGYGNSQYLGNAAINAPYDLEGCNTYMGSTIFSTGPFDASLCAAYCSAQLKYNLEHPPSDGSPVKTCQFFNTYLLYVNDLSHTQGQYCAIYSEAWDSSYATNVGQYRGSDYYLIGLSYTYTNATNPGLTSGDKTCAVAQASVEISYSSLQPYCSTLLGFVTDTVTASTTITSTFTSTVVSQATATAANNPIPKRSDIAVHLVNGTPLIPSMIANSIVTPVKRSVAATPAGLTKYPGSAPATKPTIAVTVYVTDYVSTTTSTTTTSTTTTTASATPSFVIASDTEKSQYVAYEDYFGLKMKILTVSPITASSAAKFHLDGESLSSDKTRVADTDGAGSGAPSYIFMDTLSDAANFPLIQCILGTYDASVGGYPLSCIGGTSAPRPVFQVGDSSRLVLADKLQTNNYLPNLYAIPA
ncbi:hypothetical protein BELL_0177g00210 [Botrytis elliptica]|uniref:Apple domain-containing protein n=1 Tax=Botrytis elliptica TaxID=278938 RepID=A0A4Z1JS42_9HELO|nr:hypothetical protein EAE99_005257 [Botrytis elliptica]TGO76064.1 hypothetical protein BELL_0177g00210 [Botrytis elliptica]